MAINRMPLEERIESIRTDIESYIATKVAAVKIDCPGLPDGTIRNTLVRGNCLCASFLDLKAKDTA